MKKINTACLAALCGGQNDFVYQATSSLNADCTGTIEMIYSHNANESHYIVHGSDPDSKTKVYGFIGSWVFDSSAYVEVVFVQSQIIISSTLNPISSDF